MSNEIKRNSYLYLSIFVVLFLSMLGFVNASIPSITWINPSADGNVYWNDFDINITTNVSANCTYMIYYNGTNINATDNLTTVGNGSLSHNATFDSSLIDPGYNYVIKIWCFNNTNETQLNTSNRTFVFDYDCGDTINTTWTLRHNVSCSNSNNIFTVNTNSIVFDCNGYNITRVDYNYNAFSLSAGTHNVTIKNCNVFHVGSAFNLYGSHNNTFQNNTIYDVNYGFYLSGTTTLHPSNNTFVNNNISSLIAGAGFYNKVWCEDNVFNNNTINSNTPGIFAFYFINGTNFNIANNTVSSGINGILLNHTNATVFNNTLKQASVSAGYGYGVWLVNVTNLNLTRNNITNNSIGVYVSNNVVNSLNIYYNWIYDNSYYDAFWASGNSRLYLDDGTRGNYWGYLGNVCPGFVVGDSSNNESIVDRYAYTDKAFTNKACDCGDTVIASTKLYSNITCSVAGFALNITNSHVSLDCNNYTITVDGSSSTDYGIFASGVSNINVTNCVIKSTNNQGKGIRFNSVTNSKIENVNVSDFNNSLSDYGVILSQCASVDLINVNLSNNNVNFNILNGNYFSLRNSFLSDAQNNINLNGVFSVAIENNIIKNAVHNGIEMSNSPSHINISNNKLIGNENGIAFYNSISTINITLNNITQNNKGFYFNGVNNPSNFYVYKNWIYNNSVWNVEPYMSDVYLDYVAVKQGNYWGHDGNICPGFFNGGSNSDTRYANDAVDRYPFTDKAFINKACDCGDSIIRSTKLYSNLTCNTGTYALRIYDDNITFDCNNLYIQSNGSVIGLYIGSGNNYDNITIKNCIFNKTYDGIASYNSNNINLLNIKSYNSTLAGLYFKNNTNVSVSSSTLNKNYYATYISNVNNITLNQLSILSGLYLNVISSYSNTFGVYVLNSTIVKIRNSNLTGYNIVDYYAKDGVSLYNSDDVVLYNLTLGNSTHYSFRHNIYLSNVTDSNINEITSYWNGWIELLATVFSNITVSDSDFGNKGINNAFSVYLEHGNIATLNDLDLGSIYLDYVNNSNILETRTNVSTINNKIYLEHCNNGTLKRVTTAFLNILNTFNYTILNSTISNPSNTCGAEVGSCFAIQVQSSNITLRYNHILHNGYNNVTGISIDDATSYVMMVNNYWGYDECPLFLYHRDTNSEHYYDQAPWNSSNQTKVCQAQFLGLQIYKYPTLNQTIDRNVSNPWYYYYNGSHVNLVIYVKPGNYKFDYINVTDVNNKTLGQFVANNSNRTKWISNFTLIVNESEFNQSPEYNWNFTYLQTGFRGILPTHFTAVINVDPRNNKSVAYKSELDGSTTIWRNLLDFSNVSNLVFEISTFGKIEFLQSVNLLDTQFLNNLQNFAKYVNISNKYMEINSTALKQLNTTARLTMYNVVTNYNITQLEQRFLSDGAVCNDGHCHNYTYNSTTHKFSVIVDHWSNYKLDIDAPVISSGSPKGTISTRSSVNLSVQTDENATCKFSICTTNDCDKSYRSMTNVFVNSNNGLTHYKSVSVNAGYTYFVFVRCNDSLNNINNVSYKFSFSIREASSSGGSSGGNSYAGGSSEENKEESKGEYKRTLMMFVNKGENVEYRLHDDKLPLAKLEFKSKYQGSLNIYVKTYENKPEEIPKSPSEKIFKYLNITPEKPLVNTTLLFKVSKAWIKSQGLTKEEVVIYHYKNGKWIALNTKYEYEDDKYVYYSALTPSFSYFAIGAIDNTTQEQTEKQTTEEKEQKETQQIQEQQKQEQKETQQTQEQQKQEQKETQQTQEQQKQEQKETQQTQEQQKEENKKQEGTEVTTSTTKSNKTTKALIIGLIIVLLIGGYVLFVYKQNKKSQLKIFKLKKTRTTKKKRSKKRR